MAEQAQQKTENQKIQKTDEAHTCELCGRVDAMEFADRWLCPDCYAGCGSCCSGEFVPAQDADVA